MQKKSKVTKANYNILIITIIPPNKFKKTRLAVNIACNPKPISLKYYSAIII
jgi:hypothetical protein